MIDYQSKYVGEKPKIDFKGSREYKKIDLKF